MEMRQRIEKKIQDLEAQKISFLHQIDGEIAAYHGALTVLKELLAEMAEEKPDVEQTQKNQSGNQ